MHPPCTFKSFCGNWQWTEGGINSAKSRYVTCELTYRILMRTTGIPGLTLVFTVSNSLGTSRNILSAMSAGLCCTWWGCFCASSECSPYPTLFSNLYFTPSWHNSSQCPPGPRPTEGLCACIPAQLRCFSLGPLTASTTAPSALAEESYERYVVGKRQPPPKSVYQLHCRLQSVSSFSSFCRWNPQDGSTWGENGCCIWNHAHLWGQKGAAEQNRSRGQKRSTNTPHTHHLILRTENVIGWRSEEGQIAAGTGGYCLPRKQVKRTQDSEAQVMNWKRLLVLSHLWGENVLWKWPVNTQFTPPKRKHFCILHKITYFWLLYEGMNQSTD